jgi:hypothetical protein
MTSRTINAHVKRPRNVLSGSGLAEEGGETIVVVARGVVQSTIGLHVECMGRMLMH